MNQIKRKQVNVLLNGSLINSINITDTTTAIQLAASALVTVNEAQALLDTRIVNDNNNTCCLSPLPIINSITAVGDYDLGTVTITVDITNVDTDIYTISVLENNVSLLNSTQIDLTSIISGLTFEKRVQRIFDVVITSENCAGSIVKEQSFSLGPVGYFYSLGNTNLGEGFLGILNISSEVLLASIGDSVQVQYFRNNTWYNQTRTVFGATSTLVQLTDNDPLAGIPLSTGSIPLYARFRNLTTGSSWFDFGLEIPPAGYP